MKSRNRSFVRTACGHVAVMIAIAASVVDADVIRISSGDDLQTSLDRAQPGDVIELGEGIYPGPIEIRTSVTLRGDGAIIDGGGMGQTLVIAAPDVVVAEITVRESGEDIGGPDACIYIRKNAANSVVRGCTVRRCGFGIWVHETDGVQLLDNHVESRDDVRVSDRGNGIHLFNASHLLVRGNTVQNARDGIYVSATEDSVIEGNVASEVRYGVHYMYSYRNRVIKNVTHASTIGIALMESRDLVVEDNLAEDNKREGLLFRDVLHSQIRRNVLRRNGTGMFFYSSTENTIEENEILDNEIGLKIWAGSRRNQLTANTIRGNREQVFYVGAEDQFWGEDGRGNYWGDYIGWDQDGDGIGDRPHRVDSFSASLLYRYPSAVLLLRSPALEMLSHLEDQLAVLRTPTIIDRAPLIKRGEP